MGQYGGSFSPYIYVGNHPLSYVDRDGRFGWEFAVAAVFTVVAIYDAYEFFHNSSEALDSAKAARDAKQHELDQLDILANKKPGEKLDPQASCKASGAEHMAAVDLIKLTVKTPPGTSVNPPLGLSGDVNEVGEHAFHWWEW